MLAVSLCCSARTLPPSLTHVPAHVRSIVNVEYVIANDGSDHTLAQLTLSLSDEASPLKVAPARSILTCTAVQQQHLVYPLWRCLCLRAAVASWAAPKGAHLPVLCAGHVLCCGGAAADCRAPGVCGAPHPL